jgi:hypothetical protein
VVIEIAARFHPDGQRFLVKNYPKDKEPRRVGLSAHIRDLLAGHIAGKAADDLLFSAPSRVDTQPRPDDTMDADLGTTEPSAAGKSYRHGTLTGYSSGGCRCEHCRGAYASYRARTASHRRRQIPRHQTSR